MRLLPVLTNGGSAEAGGMKQYIDWIDPALTVAAFYTNDTIKVTEDLLSDQWLLSSVWLYAAQRFVAQQCVAAILMPENTTCPAS
jgi:hypothetical protein